MNARAHAAPPAFALKGGGDVDEVPTKNDILIRSRSNDISMLFVCLSVGCVFACYDMCCF